MDHFGNIRSLMQEPPSSEVWEQLRVLLDKAPKRAREQVLYAYCRDHLASWPDEIKRSCWRETTSPLRSANSSNTTRDN